MDDDESDDEAYIRPAAKKTKTTQAAVTDFFGKTGPPEAAKKATARKPSGSKPAAAKKPASRKRVESEVDEEISEVAEVRPAAPTRAARGKAKKYIEIGSDSDGDTDEDMYGE